MKEKLGAEDPHIGESLDDFLPTPQFVRELCGSSQSRVFRGMTEEETIQVSGHGDYCEIVIGEGKFQWTIGIGNPPHFGDWRLMRVTESINSQEIYDYYLELSESGSTNLPNVLDRRFSPLPVQRALHRLTLLNSLRQELSRLN